MSQKKEEETKNFQQFSSSLVSLILKPKSNRENNSSRPNRFSAIQSGIDNDNSKNEPNDLESLLNQLNNQKNIVKETMSYSREVNSIRNNNDLKNLVPRENQSERMYINVSTPQENTNAINVNNLIDESQKNNLKKIKEYEEVNHDNQIKQKNTKVPLIQTIRIDDDLQDTENKNITEYIPIMTSIPLVNPSIAYQSNNENQNESKVQNQTNNYLIKSIPIYDNITENDDFKEDKQQINNNSKLKPVKKDKGTPIKVNEQSQQNDTNQYVNIRTPSPHHDSKKKDHTPSSVDNKEVLDQNNFIVEVNDSDDSDHDNEKKDLDYYSKSLKRNPATLKTQEIHDIQEVKGESDDEDENKPPEASNLLHNNNDDEFCEQDNDIVENKKIVKAPISKQEKPKKKESKHELPKQDSVAIVIDDIDDDIPEMKLEIEDAIIPPKNNDKTIKALKDNKSIAKQKKSTSIQNKNNSKKEQIKKVESNKQKASPRQSSQNNTSNNNQINKSKGNKELSNTVIKNKRDSIIQSIDKFDTSNPDLTGKYTQILDFNGRDKSLIKAIPNYQDIIIKPEGNHIFLKRREGFLMHRYFESKIEGTDDTINDFIIFLQKCKYPYPKLIISNFKQLKDKKHLFPKKANPDELFISKSNPTSFSIGPIESISTFIYKYSMNLFTDLIDEALGIFSHWRQVKADGNSFYRVIMFSIIEKLILSNQIERIEMLCNEINNMKEFFKKKNVDYENALAVFNIVINHMNRGEIAEGYDIFIKAYNTMKGNAFDKTLTFYLRKIAFNYITETLHLIKSEVTKMHAKMNMNLVLNDIGVLEDYIEPEFDIVSMVKYLFNTELEFFWVDGGFEKPSFSRNRLANKTLAKENLSKEEFTVSKIYIGYFYSSYYIIYPNENHIESPILEEKISKCISSYTQLVHITKDKIKCAKCEQKSSTIYLLLKGVCACFTCLKKFVEKVLIERAKNYALANFVSFEYYTRSIQLTSTVYLNNYEFIEIELEVNIADRIFNLVQDICFECGELLNSKGNNTNRQVDNGPANANKGKNELKCKCTYCHKCLWENQLKATNGLKVINSFEKFKFQKIQCCCNQLFDPDDAQRFCKQIQQEDINNAIMRMTRYINSKCFICVKRSVDPDHIADFHLIKIRPEDGKNRGIDYNDGPHTICNDCYKLEKNNMESNTATNRTDENAHPRKNTENDNNDTKVIFCNICRKEHQTDKNQWIISKEHAPCCNNDCIIF